LNPKKVVFVVAPEGFNDDELLKPKAILEEGGVQVTVASTKIGECRGMRGTKIRSERTIKELSPGDYDGIIVVGGRGALKYLSEDSDLIEKLRAFNEEGRLVSAIGRGRHALHNAGLFGTNFAWGPEVEINRNVIAARPPATTPGWTSERYGRLLAEYLLKTDED
jgi:protease I